MVYVITADQRNSRRSDDAVVGALPRLTDVPTLRGFERTVGDELQAVLDDPLSVVRAIVVLMDTAPWHIGIGIGDAELPLPESVRAARGPAFLAARASVDLAKQRDSGIEVSAQPDAGPDTEAASVACQLLADLVTRRSEAGVEAIRLTRAGQTQAQVADQLGVTRQAVGQRLQAARWSLEQRTIPVLAHLLERVARAGATTAERLGR